MLITTIVMLTTTAVLGVGLSGYAMYKMWEGKRKRDEAILRLRHAYAEI